MTFKPRIAAGAAALALAAGGLGMAGMLSAGASTPPCGDCSDIWSLEFHHEFPLDVYHGQASSGQPVILFQRSNSDPAEDFVVTGLGLVDSVYRHHRNLISTGFSQAFGSDAAFEIEYEPLGVPSHLCVGTTLDEAAYSGEPVALYPCGESPSTVWVLDTADGVSPVPGYDPYVNGATDSFSDPLVLTYPAGNPTDMPRPQLDVQPLSSFSDGTIYDSQLWNGIGGPPPPPPSLPPTPTISPTDD